MEIIESRQGDRLALIVTRLEKYDSTSFFTTNSDELQVGTIVKEAGSTVDAHIHKKQKRQLERTTEVLHVTSGTLKVLFYDDERQFICERILERGSTLIQFRGGHSFEFLTQTRMIEVKQGPYLESADKYYFEV